MIQEDTQMKHAFCYYDVSMLEEKSNTIFHKRLYLKISPYEVIRTHLYKYYPNAIGFRRVYNNLSKGVYHIVRRYNLK